MLRLSAIADAPLIAGETLVLFDEVQECREIVAAIKYLAAEGSYRYIMSGARSAQDLIGKAASAPPDTRFMMRPAVIGGTH